MYIYSIIFMSNKSVMTFIYVNKYLSIYDPSNTGVDNVAS